MRGIFCGNLEFDAHQSDVERLFRNYGRVDSVDMKSGKFAFSLPEGLKISHLKLKKQTASQTQSAAVLGGHYHWNLTGFAFVYMEDERDAEDAEQKLDRIEFGRKRRRLRVEWTKQERRGRRSDSSRKPSTNTKPSKNLFVINFDPIHTRTSDLEKHFEHYGRVSNVRIRRNFAFVHYDLLEDATRALEATHMSKFMDRVISVEYAIRDDDDKRNGFSPDRRGRDMSPDRRNYGRGHSPNDYRRDRDSPDYGSGSVPNPRSEQRESSDYNRAESPAKDKYRSRSPCERSPSQE